MSYDGTIRLDTGIDDKGITSDLGKLGGLITAGVAAAGAALAGLGAAAIKVGSDFEAGMSKVAAISGASASDMEKLTDVAKQMGEATKFSATESAEALTYMAMAGWKTEQMISGLPGIMNLAAASGEDLGLVSDIVTDALTGFGMAAEESGHFADVLAAASNNANTNVSMLGESFKYVAPVAGALGYSVEDTSVALGLMANSGIKASQAGTALRTLLTNLVKPTDQMKNAMQDLGIELTNMDGTMKPLSQLMVEMRASFDGLTESEQAMYAATLAGKEGMSGLLAIVNASEDDFQKLSAAIANADGTAQRMADTMNDNLQGKLTLLGSAMEGVGIKIYESFQEPLKDAVDSAIDSVGKLSKELSGAKMQSALDRLASGFSNLTSAAADLAAKAIPVLVSAMAALADSFATIVTALAAVTAGFVAFQIVQTITTMIAATTAGFTLLEAAMLAIPVVMNLVTAAQTALNIAMAANPIGILIAAAAALVTGLLLLRNVFGDTSSEADELNSSLDNLEGRLESQAQAAEASAKAHEESIASIEAEAVAAEKLAKKVTDLAAKENKSAADKVRLKQYVDMLNQSVAGLNLSYDEQANALSMTATQINKVVAAQKEQLLQQARQERALKLAKDQVAAEDALTEAILARLEAEEKLAEAQEKLNHRTTHRQQDNAESYYAYKQAQKAVNELSAAVEDATEKEAAAQAQVDKTTDALNRYEDGMVDAGVAAEEAGEQIKKSFDDAEDAVADFSVVSSDSINDFINSISLTEDALKDNIKALDDYTSQATDMFGKIKLEAALSFDQIMENLLHNQNAMQDWATNLQALVDKRVHDGILAQLEAIGPAAALMAAELAAMSDEQLQAIGAAMEGGIQSAINRFLVGVRDGSRMVEPEIASFSATVRYTLGDAMEKGNFAEVGGSIVNQVVDSLVNDTSISESGRAKIEELRGALNDSVAAGGFNDSALAILLELSDALANDESVPASARALYDAMVGAFEGQIASNSPAELGAKIVVPLADNIRDAPNVPDAARQNIMEAADSMKTAAEGADTSPVADKMLGPIGDAIEESTVIEEAFNLNISVLKERAPSIVEGAGFEEVGDAVTGAIGSGAVDSTGMEDAIDEKMPAVKEHADSAVEEAGFQESGELIDEKISAGVEDGEELDTQIKASIKTAKDSAVTEVGTLNFADVGKNIIEGIVKGLQNNTQQLAAAARSVAKTAYDAAIAELQIQSPSRKFRYVGEMADAGIVQGLEDGKQLVADTAAEVVQGAITAATIELKLTDGKSEATYELGAGAVNGLIAAAQDHEVTASETMAAVVLGMYEAAKQQQEMSAEELIGAMKASFDGYLTHTQNLFGQIKEDTALTVSEMIDNLQHNQQAIAEWSQNLATLTARGVDEGIIAKLRAAGPEAAGTVKNLVDASDSELGKLNGAFQKGTAVATKAMQSEFDSYLSTEPGRQLVDAIKTGLNTAIAAAGFDTNGLNIAGGVFQGITDSKEAAAEATGILVNNIDEGVNSAAEAHSPAQRFVPHGENIAAGVAEGIKNDASAAELATAAEEAIDATTRAAEAAVRSAGFDNVGRSISEGIAAGIRSGASAVTGAIQEIISSALAAAREATDSHSPARRFMPLGEDIDAGVAVGMERRGLTPQAVAGSISSAFEMAKAAVRFNQGQVGAAQASAITYNNTTSSRSGDSVTFEDGAIRVEGAPINNDLDAERIMRKAADKTSKAGRWKGVFNPV